MAKIRRKKLSSFQIILLGFALVILVGSILLTLPISSKSNTFTPFIDALFTATSSVCVTGLVIYDTATHWSIFGQIIILVLIQIGGMGVVTVATLFALLVRKKIGLFERDTIKEALSAQHVGGIVKLTHFIVKRVFIIELVGALIMMPSFCIEYGAEGIWMSIFHSISAFCNAGFDIMGSKTGEFSSLTAFSNNIIINVTIMSLIIIGGIGFLVWEDVHTNKLAFKKYRTQSKVVLITTGLLILLPAIYLFFFEFNDLPFQERLLVSLFQAVTPRTAGFNTGNLLKISEAGLLVMIVLMLIGGSPGSTAGGFKTTTFAIFIATIYSVFRKREYTEIMKRRVEDSTIRNAATLLMLYLILFLTGGALISSIEQISLLTCLFETASAIGTVGLSLGITPTLGSASKIILMVLMFFGRVGGLTLIYAAFGDTKKIISTYPIGKIMVG